MRALLLKRREHLPCFNLILFGGTSTIVSVRICLGSIGKPKRQEKIMPNPLLNRRKPSTNGIRHFRTKVVGVTKKNDDGSSRQKSISRCVLVEQLVLNESGEAMAAGGSASPAHVATNASYQTGRF